MEVNGDLSRESVELADLVAPGAPISWNQRDFMCSHFATLAKQQLCHAMSVLCNGLSWYAGNSLCGIEQ